MPSIGPWGGGVLGGLDRTPVVRVRDVSDRGAQYHAHAGAGAVRRPGRGGRLRVLGLLSGRTPPDPAADADRAGETAHRRTGRAGRHPNPAGGPAPRLARLRRGHARGHLPAPPTEPVPVDVPMFVAALRTAGLVSPPSCAFTSAAARFRKRFEALAPVEYPPPWEHRASVVVSGG